ncbi:MAG: hypothetical protein AUH11_18595 [Acidobacteria bacterium 13_2_20CM_57_17]|nr:MAG: hypothetical protein AUH11_18595 [Acidobacteria bacterium 13_2_20CM_57_17]OLB94972.1 MAG: hypothetical protein AUI02_04320 [Acidobacteria bacterium 13_2_20CM_2_57_12]OLE17021.1 MAG: hypothetical protein AUG83_00760 [Acidobacteria bacterium 13_1_20CM_4_57_11]
MYLDEATGRNQRCRPEGRRYDGPACQRNGSSVRPMQEEERFLSSQADAFAGVKAEEKVGLLVRNDCPGD